LPRFNVAKKNGYEPIEVDEYCRSLEQEKKSLEQQLAKERGDRESINNAVIAAQLYRDKTIAEATAEAERLTAQATEKVSAETLRAKPRPRPCLVTLRRRRISSLVKPVPRPKAMLRT
jgi:cell division septum initiation protein DivIVA